MGLGPAARAAAALGVGLCAHASVASAGRRPVPVLVMDETGASNPDLALRVVPAIEAILAALPARRPGTDARAGIGAAVTVAVVVAQIDGGNDRFPHLAPRPHPVRRRPPRAFVDGRVSLRVTGRVEVLGPGGRPRATRRFVGRRGLRIGYEPALELARAHGAVAGFLLGNGRADVWGAEVTHTVANGLAAAGIGEWLRATLGSPAGGHGFNTGE
jgi:hypothetical protein